MNNLTKTVVYVLLVSAALFFGTKFYSNYKAGKVRGEAELNNNNDSSDRPAPPVSTNPVPEQAADTNAAPADTNLVAQMADTNVLVITNQLIQKTNAAEAANTAAAVDAPKDEAASKPKGGQGSMMAYLGAFLASVIILGLFVAKDVSNLLGQEAIDFVFNDDLKGVYDPQYEEAMNLLHRGQHLAAIQVLREFLEKNPQAQYAALEIAEIYEKNLNNPIAAILEYQEILKKKLPAERWGWAAIHLCNLYSKQGQKDKTLELLRRIVTEHGETAAGKKAQKRLTMYETGGDMELLGADVPDGMEAHVVKPAEAKPAAKPAVTVKVRGKALPKEDAPVSNLPPGFRPK
ncbi:MAG: hypothetical protein JWM68_1511 [Verrucomicrobiales bacterium]|nr:hypothetical protein [Verrucomicrobiales bacterium]